MISFYGKLKPPFPKKSEHVSHFCLIMSLKPLQVFFAFFASFFDAGSLVICSYTFRASTVVQILFEPLFDPIDFYDTAIAKHHTTECVYEKSPNTPKMC